MAVPSLSTIQYTSQLFRMYNIDSEVYGLATISCYTSHGPGSGCATQGTCHRGVSTPPQVCVERAVPPAGSSRRRAASPTDTVSKRGLRCAEESAGRVAHRWSGWQPPSQDRRTTRRRSNQWPFACRPGHSVIGLSRPLPHHACT
jgi:hypothetical protein